MTGFPQEITVVLGKSQAKLMTQEQWGVFDVFRKLIMESNQDMQNGMGIRLARPFYERFAMHLLMFDDIFRDFDMPSEKNEIGLQILSHIKSHLVGKHYHKITSRDDGVHSIITIEKALMHRVLTRRAERGSIEAHLKRLYITKKFEQEGTNYRFHFKTDAEHVLMREALAYASMTEVLQTSQREESREIGCRLAKENYTRMMIAHHILDTRDGYCMKGEVLDTVRNVLRALDRDSNGLLSLQKASDRLPEDVPIEKYPLLWAKLRSYDANGDGYLTAQEQNRLKEAIALLVQRGIIFDLDGDNIITFEEAEQVLSKELPMCH